MKIENRKKKSFTRRFHVFFTEIKVSEYISIFIGLLFTSCYIIFPVWLFPCSIIFDFFLFLLLWIINIIIVYYISFKLKDYEEELKVILKNFKFFFKHSLKIILIIFIIVIIIFFEQIFLAPLESRGDEPTHIYRIIRLYWFWTYIEHIPGQISLFIIVITLLGFSKIFLYISRLAKRNNEKFEIITLLKGKNLFSITSPILICLFLLIGAKFVAPELYSNSTYYLFGRYGPIHPLIYTIPLFLFNINEILIPMWRLMNLMTSLCTLSISSYLIIFLNEIFLNKKKNNKDISPKRIYFSTIFVLPIIFIPAMIEYLFSVWLTTGVLFFISLSCVFTLKYLTEKSQKRKDLFLIFNFVIIGIGILWKEILLLQFFIFALIIIINNLTKIKKNQFKEFLNKLGKNFLSFFTISGLIGFPFFFLVQFFNLSWRSYQPKISNIFSKNILDYFNRRYIELGSLADIFYIFLFLLIIISVFKKKYHLLFFPMAFTLWYIFFTLDDGWPHTVDRFMSIPLLIIIFATALIIHGLEFFPEKFKNKFIYSNQRKNLLSIGLILLILIPTAISGYKHINQQIKKTRLPYGDVIIHIKNEWDNDSEKIYCSYGPNSLNFYAQIENFPLYKYCVPMLNQSIITTTDEFLNYCHKDNIRFIALPNSWHVGSNFPSIILKDLISFGINETIKMKEFIYYESTYYVWDLRYNRLEN